jgi:flagellin-like protein
MTGTYTRDRNSRKGQSETIGLVLLFGMTFISISTILVIGAPVIDDARENAQLEKTQVEFATLDQQIRESVYTPSDSGASISLSEGGISVDPNSLTVNFTYDNNSGPPVPAKTTLGGMEYDHENMGVAYQNGGVWTRYRNGGTVTQSPPDMTYTGQSLSMTLINFTDSVDVAGSGTRLSISHGGVRKSDDLTDITDGALENGTLTIDIGTDYAGAWSDYLNRTGMEVTSVSGNSVRAEIRTGPPLFAVEYLSERFSNSSGDPGATVYSSGIGDASQYNYTVDTDTVVSSKIDPLPVTSSDIDDLITPRSGSDTLPSPGSKVTAGDYRGDDDLDGHTFDTSSGRIRYLANPGADVSIANNPVTFNTTGGPVEVHVPSDFNLNQDVFVNGNSPVRIYVGEDTQLDNNYSVNIENGRSELFQIYSSDSDVQVDDVNFNGTLYAPDANVTIDSDSTFRGAVIANDLEVDGEYYHDTSLRQADVPEELNPPLSRFNAAERLVELR